MIRREESDSLWVIHQAAHACIAGQIAEHWIGSGTMNYSPREELLIAVYCHDAGWAAAERLPRINQQGVPRTFTEMDLDEHLTIWQDSIWSVFAQNRYAGLLTSLHCTELYELRLQFVNDPPPVQATIRAFLESQHAWERRLVEILGDHPRYALAVQPDRLADNLRLLQVWDYLSLLLCMSAVQEQNHDDVPLAYGTRAALQVASGGARAMALDPYPLDQPLTLWIDARPVPDGPFASDAELQEALDHAPYKPLVFEVKPL
jgi:hypothetical protein